MSKKKSNEPEESAENQELVRRVDSMMSTELPEATPGKLVKPVKADKVTKPQPPPKLPPEPPIVITLADEDKPAEEPATRIEADKPSPAQAKDPLEDNTIDKAVDDIVAHEGDTVLAVNDALTARKQAAAQPGRPSGDRGQHKWFWLIIFIMLLGTAIDAAIFLSRR